MFYATDSSAERYRSGRNGGASKASCPVRGTGVRIPPSPPTFAKRSLRSRLRLAGRVTRAVAKVGPPEPRAVGEGGLLDCSCDPPALKRTRTDQSITSHEVVCTAWLPARARPPITIAALVDGIVAEITAVRGIRRASARRGGKGGEKSNAKKVPKIGDEEEGNEEADDSEEGAAQRHAQGHNDQNLPKKDCRSFGGGSPASRAEATAQAIQTVHFSNTPTRRCCGRCRHSDQQTSRRGKAGCPRNTRA